MSALLLTVALLAVSAAGCWLGAPPDQRQAITREVRRELAIRKHERRLRAARR